MAEIIPFKGLRYNADIVGDFSNVTTPPYDIISSEEQDAFYSKSPYNSIRLEFPKDDVNHNKYLQAGETLNSWLNQKVLTKDSRDSLYIYQQEFDLNNGEIYTRTGLIGLIRLEEFDKGIILPHENTLSKPKADRLQLMRACNSNFSQVFGLYDDIEQKIPTLIRDYCEKYEPVMRIDKGIVDNTEKIWAICDPPLIEKIKNILKNKRLYIADGHHRYETALAYRDELRSKNPRHTGNELYNYVMMAIVEMDDPGLIILPTHRMVNGVKNFHPSSFISDLNQFFTINQHNISRYAISDIGALIEKILHESDPHTFVLYMKDAKDLYSLSLKSLDKMEELHPKRHGSYLDLDVSILHTLIFDKLLGIGEKELANQENLEYTHSIKEGVGKVYEADQQMTFFMSPTSIRQIQEISLVNEKMPQKSTYFYPKLLTGLVFNRFE